MEKREVEDCKEVRKTKLVHCGSNTASDCKCDEEALMEKRAVDDYDEQTISLCKVGHHEVKNAFLGLDFVAKRMENRENHLKVRRRC